ncbi:DNA-directed RNA polymerase subunit omega [Fructilactobacillus vespulae]|uniref:DNA-directed RNA polymerase subunit omega n=1 Tax=Fructilactobacillus vespulae TaxID=1249630 RepID=UPI0039B6460E
MLYPSIDKLLEIVDSRYSLIMLASKRAEELDQGAAPLLTKYHNKKTVGMALEEIAAGVLKIEPSK